MANENSIKVDLEFQLAQGKLKQTLNQAGKDIKSGLASSVKGLGETSIEREDRQARFKAQQKLDKINTDNAVEAASRRLRAGRLWREREKNREERPEQDRSRFRLKMSATALPIAQPGGAWANYWAGQSIYSAFKNTQTGKNVMGSFGLSGSGGATVATAAFLAGANAIGAAVLTFRKAVQEFYSSVDRARFMYSQSMQNGMGLQMNNRLSLAGNILGVNPQEVWQYGRAFGYLDDRLKSATAILTQTNPVLTMTSWKFGILRADISALWASISEKFSPAAQSFVDWVDKIVKKLYEGQNGKPSFVEDVSRTFSEISKRMKAELWAEKHGIKVKIEENSRGAETGFHFADSSGLEFKGKKAKRIMEWFMKESGLDAVTEAEKAPSPAAYMKRLPASAWEHMGLVIGGQGATNYAKNTAENTKKANEFLSKLPAEIARVLASTYLKQNQSLPSMP